MEIFLNMAMTEFQKPGQNASFCSVALMPGNAVPYDYGQENCGGSLWVRLSSANPSASFPLADVTVNNCTSSLAYPLEIGVMRPAPLAEMVGDAFQLPTDAENSAATEQQLADMESMYAAIIAFADEVELLTPGIYTPIGPEGGVVGGRWTLTVGL
jgi:hypothetical protein